MISPYVFPGIKPQLITEFSSSTMKRRKITPERIMEIVAEKYGVTVSEILSRIRKKEVVEARHIFCTIMKKEFDYSLKSIGQMVSGRDHTTVIHSINTVKDRCDTEEGYKELVNSTVDLVYSNM
jgi:chromosomal replication initiator protein